MGVGIANVQDELNNCYGVNGDEEMIKSEYNTHNQYFDITLSLGILGILIFVLMLAYPMYLSIIQRNHVYLFFLIFISLCFFSENLLSRQYGVIFFAFFHSLFAHLFLSKKG